jgi:MATE family multidrug resistance protein
MECADDDPSLTADDSMGMTLRVVRLASTTTLSSVLCFLLQTATQAFVGRRIGSDALAHYAIGVTAFNIAGLSVGYGLSSALDTLASQAYGRNPRNPEIGQQLQRSVAVTLAVTLPISYLQVYHSEGALSFAFGQDLGRGASAFIRSAWLYLPLSTLNESFMKVLQAQNTADLIPLPTSASLLAAYFACDMIVEPDKGIGGAAVALTIANLVMFAGFLLLFCFHPRVVVRHTAWWPPSAVFSTILDRRGLREYLSVGIPSLVSLCAEWWAIEAMLVVAAQISATEVAMLSIALAVTSTAFSVAIGIGSAASVVVGNALGANKPALAAKYSLLILAVDQVPNAIIFLCVCFFRREIVSLFTEDSVLISRFCSLSWMFVVAFELCDSTQYTLQGIFRGSGKQRESARTLLVSLWLVGVPASTYLGVYHGLGAEGVMAGLMCGFFVEIPVLWSQLQAWDWEAIASDASRLVNADCTLGEQLPLLTERPRGAK